MIIHIVTEQENNKTIERILLSAFNIERNAVYKALRKKDIKINGKRVSDNMRLAAGDRIEAYIFFSKDQNEDINNKSLYKVIYENDIILIADKKQGVPVTDDKNGEISLIKHINNDFSSNYELCHRIDRNTGGLVIISKKHELTQRIKDAINNRFYNKIYKCIVWGNAENIIGVKKAWLFKDVSQNRVYIYSEKRKYTKEIITEILKAKYDAKSNTTLLEINLITGRTHQIRAHLAFLGHQIIGDGKYGANDVNRRFGYKYQALWACSLIPNNIDEEMKDILPDEIISTEPKFL